MATRTANPKKGTGKKFTQDQLDVASIEHSIQFGTFRPFEEVAGELGYKVEYSDRARGRKGPRKA